MNRSRNCCLCLSICFFFNRFCLIDLVTVFFLSICFFLNRSSDQSISYLSISLSDSTYAVRLSVRSSGMFSLFCFVSARTPFVSFSWRFSASWPLHVRRAVLLRVDLGGLGSSRTTGRCAVRFFLRACVSVPLRVPGRNL